MNLINTLIAVGAVLAVIGLCIKEALVMVVIGAFLRTIGIGIAEALAMIVAGTLLAAVGMRIEVVWRRGKKK